MARKKVAVQFICYSPRIYSGFDKFNLELAGCLKEAGIGSVFVFSDAINVRSIYDDLKNAEVTVELISTKSRLTILRDILKIFFRYRPIIVHSHFENYIQLTTAIFSKLYGAQFFITFHSTISLLSLDEYVKAKGLIKQRLLKFYYRFLIRVSANVFCVSGAIKTQFCLFSRSNSNKIKCLYLGVVLKPIIKSKEEIRDKLSLPNNKVLFCNVSAFEYIKGIDILINAIQILKERYQLTEFLFYHIGGLRRESVENVSYRQSLYDQAKKLNVGNNIVWMGHRNDIEEILYAFDIYVHPSRMEGLPVSIMEACSNALPVIGTDIGGIPEIVFNNRNGLLFECESADELAEKIKKLLQSKSERDRFGEESRIIAEELFNIKTQTKVLVDNYLQALKP
jgi:glycosyltransferase involved in cell wall biosynthesis